MLPSRSMVDLRRPPLVPLALSGWIAEWRHYRQMLQSDGVRDRQRLGVGQALATAIGMDRDRMHCIMEHRGTLCRRGMTIQSKAKSASQARPKRTHRNGRIRAMRFRTLDDLSTLGPFNRHRSA